MVANRMENAPSGGEAAKGDAAKPAVPKENPGTAEVPVASSGGLQAWLPLIIMIVAMPLLAYATTTFLILPKLHPSAGGEPATAGHETAPAAAKKTQKPASTSSAHGAPAAGKEGLSKTAANKVSFPKILVNVKGTMATRYLMASLTLVAADGDAKGRIEENRDLVQDLASSTLEGKTLADLEKPDWRNRLRSELTTVFNDALGQGTVQEIFIPEIAVQ